MDKLNVIEIENTGTMKKSVRRINRQATRWGKIFENHVSDNSLISSIYKQLSKHNSRAKIQTHFTKLELPCHLRQIRTIHKRKTAGQYL